MGNRSFDEVRSEFLPLFNAVVYCYDMSNPASFENLETWRREVEPQVKKECLTVVCGLKSDQIKGSKPVSESKVNSFIKTKNSKIYEVSAKTGAGVKKFVDDMLSLT